MKELKFIKPMDYLYQKVKSLRPYCTKQEKEVLLSDDIDYIDLLKLVSDVEPLNEAEAIFLLLELRKISVSDIIEGMVECPKCKTMNDFNLEMRDIRDIDVKKCIPVGIFDKVEDILSEENSDALPLLEYNKLQKTINENNKKLLRTSTEIPCRKCQNKIKVGFEPKSLMSKSTPESIFQEYFNFGFYMSYSNKDVDDLLPYERSILHGLLKKKLESEPTSALS